MNIYILCLQADCLKVQGMIEKIKCYAKFSGLRVTVTALTN